MNRDGHETESTNAAIDKLSTSATQTVEQLRQIKVIVLIYAAANLYLLGGARGGAAAG